MLIYEKIDIIQSRHTNLGQSEELGVSQSILIQPLKTCSPHTWQPGHPYIKISGLSWRRSSEALLRLVARPIGSARVISTQEMFCLDS